MEGEGGLDAVRHVDLAHSLVAGQGAIDTPQHHVDLGVLKLQAEQLQRALDLFLGDAHGLLLPAASLAASTTCRGLLAERGLRGRSGGDEL